MHLLKSIRKGSELWVLLLAIIFRLLLLNYNSAEWGDTYRILRAAEISRSSFYPSDEKRPPLLSLIISTHPSNMDPLLYGRCVLAFFSVLALILFYIYLKKFINNKEYRILGLFLLVFNPVYLYWSLRVYADLVFSVYVLLIGLLVTTPRFTSRIKYIILLGFLTAFSVTLRFEGYLLIGSAFLYIFLMNYPKLSYKNAALFTFGALTVILPYVVFRNPLNSSYLEEPAGRVFNLTTVWIFIVSFLYSFGFLLAPVFILSAKKTVTDFLSKNIFILFFGSLSLILILLWPAAIPRLFVSIIPFLILLLVYSIDNNAKSLFTKNQSLGTGLLFISIFAFSQFVLKLQFLIVIKWVFITVLLLNLITLGLVYFNKQRVAYLFILISCCIWTFSTLYIHKDIYKSLANASIYLATSGKGLVLHNDINSVADWYINYYPFRKWSMHGVYIDIKNDPNQLSPKNLKNHDVRYVLITNEQDPSWWPNLSKATYLEELRLFRYNVNGSMFTTAVYKVRSEYL